MPWAPLRGRGGTSPRWSTTVQETAQERQGQAPATSSCARWWQYRGGAQLHPHIPIPGPLVYLLPSQDKELAPGVRSTGGGQEGWGPPGPRARARWGWDRLGAPCPSGGRPPAPPRPPPRPVPAAGPSPLPALPRCWASTRASGRPSSTPSCAGACPPRTPSAPTGWCGTSAGRARRSSGKGAEAAAQAVAAHRRVGGPAPRAAFLLPPG